MCGIAGIAGLSQNSAAPRRAELREMIERLHHRGPDGYGYYEDGQVGLAHARLSIIDLEGGSQPIHNEDRSVWVVFNGEIFNYLELRADLERSGHSFYTHSDTEVIVHLYEQHGLEFVHQLNGQFAIALWDVRRRRLILARDRTGIRPVFYTLHGGRLVFASEIKALFAHPGVPRRLRPAGISQVFTFWSSQAPATIFDGVLSLPAGHVLVLEHGKTEIRKYWDWRFPESGATARSVEDEARELRELLVDSVRLQLRADVPVGAYLSGGLDSSIVTTLIKHFTDTPLRTFSLTFEDGEFDESDYQTELVRYLGTNHTAVRCTRADIGAAFPRAIWHTETPIVRTAPAPLMLLSERVRAEGYKVVLTGEGADEVFAGYDLFREAKVRRFWGRSPQSAWRPRLLERLYPYLKHSPVAGRAFTQNFFGQGIDDMQSPWFAHMPRWRTTQRLWQFFTPEARAEAAAVDPFAEIAGRLPPEASRWAPLSRDQDVEAHTLLSGYLLCSQGDRMAMANSVEGRFPFLDHRVIEFANALPPHHKLRALEEKYVLKQAVRGLLPERIRVRTKQPYRAPDSQSFFAEGRPLEYVEALFGNARIGESGLFDPLAVRKLYEKCRAGRAIGFADNMAFVGILSTLLVEEMFVRRNAFLGKAAHPVLAG
ncbi:MAG: asparagine synthase (glutamine-hydrolyzing) [Burkholderiales bacterium]